MTSTTSVGPSTSYGGARPAQFEPTRKRKERDAAGFEAPPRRPLLAPKAESLAKPPAPAPKQPGDSRLLAGYLAHEYLTRGTLFGKPFDSTLAPPTIQRTPAAPAPAYADVARLLKGENGVHIPGVVNPTQLGRWLQKQ